MKATDGNKTSQQEHIEQLVQLIQHESHPAKVVALAQQLIQELNLMRAKQRLKSS